MNKKQIRFILIFSVILLSLFITNYLFRDSYAFYLDNSNVLFVTSKVGKFGSIDKSDIKKDAGTQLQDTAVFGLYRYYGTKDTVKNNYICFGTNDKETCLNSPETYMYRIIGITDNSTTNTDLGLKENQLKVIKSYAFNFALNSTISDVKWENTSGKIYLNGTWLTNAKKDWSDGNWDAKISEVYWWIGDVRLNDAKAETLEKSITKFKISLMYLSDYNNGASTKSDSNPTHTTEWLYAGNGWQNMNQSGEWMMTRVGYFLDRYTFYFVSNYGVEAGWDMNTNSGMRPVFYLIPDITLKGIGSTTDPYLIN